MCYVWRGCNWGRILCAIGYAEADFDIDKVELHLRSTAGSIKVCENGAGVDFSEEEAAKILHEDEIYIDIDLHQGDVSAKHGDVILHMIM